MRSRFPIVSAIRGLVFASAAASSSQSSGSARSSNSSIGGYLLSIRRTAASYGSRLHRDWDGRFVAYAEWPDEATWRAAFERKMVYDEPRTRAAFLDAIAEAPAEPEPIFTMTVLDDLLVRRG
jgi:hypothetical protein